MATRNELLGVSEYDRDGGLDYFIYGSQWKEWIEWKRERSTNDEIKKEVMKKFELCLDRAMKF